MKGWGKGWNQLYNLKISPNGNWIQDEHVREGVIKRNTWKKYFDYMLLKVMSKPVLRQWHVYHIPAHLCSSTTTITFKTTVPVSLFEDRSSYPSFFPCFIDEMKVSDLMFFCGITNKYLPTSPCQQLTGSLLNWEHLSSHLPCEKAPIQWRAGHFEGQEEKKKGHT